MQEHVPKVRILKQNRARGRGTCRVMAGSGPECPCKHAPLHSLPAPSSSLGDGGCSTTHSVDSHHVGQWCCPVDTGVGKQCPLPCPCCFLGHE